jgi:hypothetical protein
MHIKDERIGKAADIVETPIRDPRLPQGSLVRQSTVWPPPPPPRPPWRRLMNFDVR